MRSGLCFLLIAFVAITASTFAYDWTTNPGDGSPENPYQISEPDHLMSIGSNADLLDKHFILTNDIVFDPDNNPAHIFDRALIAPFSGSFNGDHHAIRNIETNSNSTIGQIGLFDGILGIGTVKNLRINNANINASENTYHHGVLAGNNEGIILNCSVQGSISGRLYLGGLVGWNTGKIQSCSASVSIIGADSSECLGGLVGDNVGEIHNCNAMGSVTSGSGSKWLGGLVGFTGGGEIISSYATGDVSTGHLSSNIGGFIGYNWAYSEVIRCYSTGKVHMEGSNPPPASSFTESVNPGDFIEGFGGLIGLNDGTVQCCLSYCDVAAGDYSAVGGLVGINNGNIFNSYAIGTINSGNEIPEILGGLIGKNSGDIGLCYASVIIETGGTSPPAMTSLYQESMTDRSLGGLIGYLVEGNVNSCFWNIEIQTDDAIESIGYNEGGIIENVFAEMTMDMLIQHTYIDFGWDFAGESVNGDNEIWRMCVDGVEYPRLSWEFARNGDFACGDGVDIFDLQALAEHWLLVGTAHPTEFNYACDANGDGVIDLLDFSTLAENWQ